MSDFLTLAQKLSVAIKALAMYTTQHPRAVEALNACHSMVEDWLVDRERLMFVIAPPKAFVDGLMLDIKSPHIAALMKMVSERGFGGFVIERGVAPGEFLVFLEALSTNPGKLEERGGIEAVLQAAGVRRIRVSQTRYREVGADEAPNADGHAPAFNPEQEDPSSSLQAQAKSKANLILSIREAMQAALTKGLLPGDGTATGLASYEDLDYLNEFHPLDLSGLGPFGWELGLGDGAPTGPQMEILREIMLGLAPGLQLGMLAGLDSLPERPAGLSMGLKDLVREILPRAVSGALGEGASWVQLKGAIKATLKSRSDRAPLLKSLAARLHGMGQYTGEAQQVFWQLAWEELSIEAKLLKVFEEGYLFELSHEERLAFLRDLLDLRRFHDFLRVEGVLIDCLRNDLPDLRGKATQTLAGVVHWVREPGLPPGAEAPLFEAFRTHFGSETDPAIHQWTTDALECLLEALVRRGELMAIISELRTLNEHCASLEEQVPWRKKAVAKLAAALLRPDLLDAVLEHAFSLGRDRMIQEVHPYLEFLGDAMARHLVLRLGEETDRTRRGRLVEVVRSMGPGVLPLLLTALGSPAWYLVRNALTLISDLGDASCLPAIVPLLRHPEPRVRRTAVRASWKLGGPLAEHHLLLRMKDTDAETMQEILFVLGQLRSEGCLPQVAELAQDKRVTERLRIQALDTLALIGSPRALPVLLECTRRKGFFAGGGEPAAIRLAAAKALAGIDADEARAALQKLVAGEPKGAEREAFRMLLEPPVKP